VTVADAFKFSLTVRYMEVDAQGVVFNAWYLTYFDEAFTAFLQSRGLGYQALIGQGLDFQLVHADIDWKAGLRFRDNAVIAVSTARLGRTSFAIDFAASRNGDEPACSARIVYVVVATDGSGKREISPEIAEALGAPALPPGVELGANTAASHPRGPSASSALAMRRSSITGSSMVRRHAVLAAGGGLHRCGGCGPRRRNRGSG
jgi:acyl-CoA thioester hydrolase